MDSSNLLLNPQGSVQLQAGSNTSHGLLGLQAGSDTAHGLLGFHGNAQEHLVYIDLTSLPPLFCAVTHRLSQGILVEQHESFITSNASRLVAIEARSPPPNIPSNQTVIDPTLLVDEQCQGPIPEATAIESEDRGSNADSDGVGKRIGNRLSMGEKVAKYGVVDGVMRGNTVYSLSPSSHMEKKSLLLTCNRGSAAKQKAKANSGCFVSNYKIQSGNTINHIKSKGLAFIQ